MLASCLSQIMPVLKDVDVHEQGLSGSRRLPQCHLSQIVGFEGHHLIRRPYSFVKCIHVCVQIFEELLRTVEVPVQVDFREQKPEVLEILRVQQMASQTTPVGDGTPMPN